MTLDEQIKHMENERDWYAGKVSGGRRLRSSEEEEACNAILESLHRLKGLEK